METLQAIQQRRSVRAFTDEPVEISVLEELVEAGTWAPSGSNVQAWKFGIVTDPQLVRKIDLFSPGMSGNPPALIILCSDRAYAQKKGGAKGADEFATLDCAYASQNIMLAAADRGLGTCAIKSYNDAALRRILNLPDNLVIELVIAMGRPAHEPKAPARKSLAEIAFYNTWN